MRSLLTRLETEVAEPPWKKPKAEDVKEEGEADLLAEEAEGSLCGRRVGPLRRLATDVGDRRSLRLLRERADTRPGRTSR